MRFNEEGAVRSNIALVRLKTDTVKPNHDIFGGLFRAISVAHHLILMGFEFSHRIS
jgi:hypothetical protein